MPQTYAIRSLNAPPAMTHSQRLFTGTAAEARAQAQRAADTAGRPSHLCLANAAGSVVDPNALERFTPTRNPNQEPHTMKTHPAFPPVGSSRGAPMGRPNTWPDTSPTRYHLKRATPTDGDYDQGGAYWGGLHDKPLFCAWSYDPDPHGFALYFRARNRKDAAQVARALIAARYP